MSFMEFREGAYYACREWRNRDIDDEYVESRHEEKIRATYEGSKEFWNRLVNIEIRSLFIALERRGYDLDVLIARISEGEK